METSDPTSTGELSKASQSWGWMTSGAFALMSAKPDMYAWTRRPIRTLFVCQAMPTKGQIVRVVQFEGKCFRETFSPFVGKVEKRESVPCNTTCPATHKG